MITRIPARVIHQIPAGARRPAGGGGALEATESSCLPAGAKTKREMVRFLVETEGRGGLVNSGGCASERAGETEGWRDSGRVRKRRKEARFKKDTGTKRGRETERERR